MDFNSIFGMTSQDWMIPFVIISATIIIIIILLFAWRKMTTGTKRLELELEKEKVGLLKRDLEIKGHPVTKLTPEQSHQIRTVEDENQILEVELYAKHRIVESRIKRLEYYVEISKLERMLIKLDNEEKKSR